MSEESESIESIADKTPQIASIPLVGQDELLAAVKDMPDVVDDAVKAAEDKEKTAKDEQAKTFDKKGRPFDASIHVADKDGHPVLTPTGRFKRKLNIPNGAKQNTAQGTTPNQPVYDEVRQDAIQCAQMFVMGCMALVGKEAEPKEGEMETLISSYEGMFRKYGSVKMGIELQFALIHFTFIASRAKQPRTAGVITGVKDFFVNWYLKLTGKNYTIKTEGKKDV